MGGGGATAMNQLWGGPACKRLRTPGIESASVRGSSQVYIEEMCL